MTAWLACDMDDGVLRREPTCKAARDWWLSNEGMTPEQIQGRHRYGPGDYEYRAGHDEKDCAQVWIVRADVAHHAGWDPEQTPLYPLDDKPYERVDREENQ